MTDLILGLPGETYDSFVNGIASVIDGGQHNRIQFNNFSSCPTPRWRTATIGRGTGSRPSRPRSSTSTAPSRARTCEERHELVIATAAMPREDWVQARAFAWMTALLHFDKLLQIPLVLAHELAGVSYRELFEVFTDGRLEPHRFPILTRLRTFFEDKARDIQRGGRRVLLLGRMARHLLAGGRVRVHRARRTGTARGLLSRSGGGARPVSSRRGLRARCRAESWTTPSRSTESS